MSPEIVPAPKFKGKAFSVLEYTDYRIFLADFCAKKKLARPGWSLRGWSRQMGLRSHSGLVMILKGRRRPGPDLARRIAKALSLDTREERYFLDLIRLEKLENHPEDSVAVMDRLLALRSFGEFKCLSQASFAAVSAWYFAVIREMVHLSNFRDDPEWISRQLEFAVTPRQVKEALRILKAMGLLKRVRGRLRSAGGHVETPNDTADETIKRFHEQALGHAQLSLRKRPPSEREVYGTTLAMAKGDLPKAKELIRRFHREFSKSLEKESTDRIYQLEIALYPVATSEERK